VLSQTFSHLRLLTAGGWGEKAQVLIFGASETPHPPDMGLRTNYRGSLHDEVSLALLYSAADVFVAPSIQDNLPNVVMEALACGTPTVAFDLGGMPDLIDHRQNGYWPPPLITRTWLEVSIGSWRTKSVIKR
jgi:glycosyltransferase involved in cell wall biosynthesis